MTARLHRLVAPAVIICCWCLHVSAQARDAEAQLAAANSIFIGWIDIPSNDWMARGYTSERAWAKVIDENNRAFQDNCRSRLRRHRVKVAKDRHHVDASGYDVRVQFADVRLDSGTYWLYLSIRFVDPKTGEETAAVPLEGYRKRGCFTIRNCMALGMNEVAVRLAKTLKRQ